MDDGIHDALTRQLKKCLVHALPPRFRTGNRIWQFIPQPLQRLSWCEHLRATEVPDFLPAVCIVDRPQQSGLRHRRSRLFAKQHQTKPRGSQPVAFLFEQPLLNQPTIEERRADRVFDLGDVAVFPQSLIREIVHRRVREGILQARQRERLRPGLLFSRRSLQRLSDEVLVRLPDHFLEVAVEHLHRDPLFLQILDSLPIYLRIGILDSNPDLLDPRKYNTFRARRVSVHFARPARTVPRS